MKKSILIIEDDHDIRVCFRHALEDIGHNVWSVANGRDALLFLELNPPPDLILLDIAMPIMGGVEFLKIKNTILKLNPIPVLVISCNRDKFELLGATSFLKKPVDMSELFVKVSECLLTPTLKNLNQL